MGIDAASIFPYPPDDPHVIAGVQSSFKGFAKDLDTTHSQVASDGSVIGGKGWSGDGSTACKTEIDGNAALIAAASTALGKVEPALKPYATAIDTARSNIDTLRKNYVRDWNTHEQNLTNINNSSKTEKQKESARSTENQNWRWTDYGANYTYQGYLSDVNTAAKHVRKSLEDIGSNVNGHKVKPGGSDLDLRLAIVAGLPMLHAKQAAQDANTVAGLAQKAAQGDPNALAELEKYKDEAGDPYFATALMNDLTAKGLVQIPAAMAQYFYDKHGRVDPQTIKNNAALLSFLSTSLATATNDTNQPHVDQKWLTDLMSAGRTQYKLPNGQRYYGYWGLGQVMEAAGKTPPYGTNYLRTVGRDLVSWVRDQTKNGPTYPRTGADSTWPGPAIDGPASDSIDNPGQLIDKDHPGMANPLYGLLHAASTNAPGAQQIFDYTPPGQKDDNLTWMLHTHRGEWVDHGNELGNALQAATVGHDAESLKLTAAAVHILGQDDKTHTSVDDNGNASFDDEADDYSGMRDSVSHMLAAHIDDLNSSLADTQHQGDQVVDGHITFDPKDLGYLLIDTERDTGAFNTLVGAQLTYTKNDLDFAASSSGINGINEVASTDSGTLGYLLQARRSALTTDARAQDAQNGMLADYVKEGLGLIPLPDAAGPLGGVAYDHMTTWITDQIRTHHVVSAYANADSSDLQAQAAINQMIQATVVKHQLWQGHQPPTQPFDTPQGKVPADFVDSLGKVIPPDKWTDAQRQHFNEWTKYYDPSLPQAKNDAGTNFDHWQTQYRRLLGLDT